MDTADAKLIGADNFTDSKPKQIQTMRKRKPQTTETPKPAVAHPFKDVRRAGCPLVCYETSDPAQTIATLRKAMNGTAEGIPLLQWDCLRGLTGLNEAGAKFCKDYGADRMTTGDCAMCLLFLYDKACEKGAEDERHFNRGVFFFHMMHRFINSEPVLQGVWNLRDKFESMGCTLVLLATTGHIPIELRNDIISITDPLPKPDEIGKIIGSIAKDAKESGCNIDAKEVEENEVYSDTLTGISGFGVKQTFALSLSVDGVNESVLWERKRKLVEQTPGLQMWKGKENFDSIGGLSRLKADLTALLTSGNTPVRAIGFLDEIEKMLAGTGGDTSGTSQDQLGVILREMQDNNIPGIILAGPPGTGKSHIAKGAGAVASAPVLAFDFGACKGSLVGESEGKIRAMMQVFQAVSQGKGLFIATCNKLAVLPPELRRRFKLGTYYVDLPSKEERDAIWPVWLKTFGLDEQASKLPMCDDWTGAEISACCEIAHRTGRTLLEAAKNIVPVAKSGREAIEQLRRAADGVFLSANHEGFYTYAQPNEGTTPEPKRVLKFS